MLRFKKLKNKKGRKTAQYAVMDVNSKHKRLGKITWRGRYIFDPHPKGRVSKKEKEEIDQFIEDLMKARRSK